MLQSFISTVKDLFAKLIEYSQKASQEGFLEDYEILEEPREGQLEV